MNAFVHQTTWARDLQAAHSLRSKHMAQLRQLHGVLCGDGFGERCQVAMQRLDGTMAALERELESAVGPKVAPGHAARVVAYLAGTGTGKSVLASSLEQRGAFGGRILASVSSPTGRGADWRTVVERLALQLACRDRDVCAEVLQGARELSLTQTTASKGSSFMRGIIRGLSSVSRALVRRTAMQPALSSRSPNATDPDVDIITSARSPCRRPTMLPQGMSPLTKSTCPPVLYLMFAPSAGPGFVPRGQEGRRPGPPPWLPQLESGQHRRDAGGGDGRAKADGGCGARAIHCGPGKGITVQELRAAVDGCGGDEWEEERVVGSGVHGVHSAQVGQGSAAGVSGSLG